MTSKRPTNKTSNKHFLDTSVARPLLLGSRKYKQYFSDEFGTDRLYVSSFVQMEFRRSFLINVINFYFVLDMPQNETISDAFAAWSNKFKGSQLKAVIQLAAQLFQTGKLDFAKPDDKPKALLAVGMVIKRFQAIIGTYTDIAINSPRCERAALVPNLHLDSLANDLKRFQERFNDVEECRSRCRIDHFLLVRHKKEVDNYVKLNNTLKKNAGTKGFKGIADELHEITSKGSKACSCKSCEKIGDAVITLDTPSNFRIEHTDSSFNQLCDAITHPHKQHPSEDKVAGTAKT